MVMCAWTSPLTTYPLTLTMSAGVEGSLTNVFFEGNSRLLTECTW